MQKIYLIFLILIYSCTPLSVRYDQFVIENDPLQRAASGDKKAASILPDVSIDNLNRIKLQLENFLIEVNKEDPNDITYRILEFVLNERINELNWHMHQIPFTNSEGFFRILDYYESTLSFKNNDDFQARILLWENLPTFFEQNIKNMEEGIKNSQMQSKLIVEKALEILKNLQIPQNPKQANLFKVFEKTPEIYQQKALALLDGPIRVSFKKVEDFLKNTYLPKAPNADGLFYQSKGKEKYESLVKFFTTKMNITPEKIHQIGLNEVSRIKSEMNTIIQEVHFKGSFKEFLHFLRVSPQFYAKSPEELLEKASYFAKLADLKMPEFFQTLPRLSYGIVKTPDHVAKVDTTGKYGSGNLKQGIAGTYYVNTYNLLARPLYELPSLTAHEAVPGHHHQFAISQELDDNIPQFRKNLYIVAYSEGWGLYSETIAAEMGLYRTPYERFGKLSYEMWRALRLVVDTGIHYYGWSKTKSVDYMYENSALSKENIISEVERYIAWPGQALGYKMGELTIRALRKKAKEKLADKFDIRKFHDAILMQGPVTLDILEQIIDDFIKL